MEALQPFLQLNDLYQFYILASAIAALGIYKLGEDKNRTLALMHSAVSVWTGVLTFNFAYEFFNPEITIYADWVVTTPLLVGTIALTATNGRFNQPLKTVGAAALQVLVVLTGYLGFTRGSAELFFLGVALFAAEFAVLWSMSDDADYEILLIALFSLWSFYPIVYFRGILKDSIPEAQVTYWLVALPLISKHLYGFIDLYLVD